MPLDSICQDVSRIVREIHVPGGCIHDGQRDQVYRFLICSDERR
jgi:hypothetical protein